MNEQFDVFISHKKEDIDIAKRLQARIDQLGYKCYVDAQDKGLSEAEKRGDGHLALPLRLREKLRNCLSLIYVCSPKSPLSRWMPWELGFFDGRYDKSAAGIYLTEDVVEKGAGQDGAISAIQEYLNLYPTVNDDNLEDFLKQTSNRVKMNVREGQVDHLMLAIRAAVENPHEFSLGCLQWYVGFWRSLVAQTHGQDVAAAWLPMAEQNLGMLRENAAVQDSAAKAWPGSYTFPFMPSQFGQMGLLDTFKQAHNDAAEVSVAIKR